jgi:hypothetical protein
MTALAYAIFGPEKATAEDVTMLYSKLKHRRQEVHIQECLDIMYKFGYMLTAIEAAPILMIKGSPVEYLDRRVQGGRLIHYMQKFAGLVYCMGPKEIPHMVYWDGKKYYDPADGSAHESFPPRIIIFFAKVKFNNEAG